MAEIPISAPPPTPPSVIEPLISIFSPISTKLNTSNYLTWKSQLLPIIHGYNLTKYITNSPPSPTLTTATGASVDNPAYPPWTRQDQMLLGWLRSSLIETVQGQVISSTTSFDLWTSLQRSFSSSSRAKLTDLHRQLQTTTKGSLSCFDFLQKLRCIADELSFIGHSVPEDDLIQAVLTGLPAKYNNFNLTVTTAFNDHLTFADLQGMLLTHEARLISQSAIHLFPLPITHQSWLLPIHVITNPITTDPITTNTTTIKKPFFPLHPTNSPLTIQTNGPIFSLSLLIRLDLLAIQIGLNLLTLGRQNQNEPVKSVLKLVMWRVSAGTASMLISNTSQNPIFKPIRLNLLLHSPWIGFWIPVLLIMSRVI